ncbi:hypothetical protein GL272_20050 [Aeromonas veronii]|nr:hypothetical protein [Aeromonas jandaei]MBW3779170.1 hypothetical protein [Aeromonas veronii]
MLHEDKVMEKTNEVTVAEFTVEDQKAMSHAAYAQCIFILAQVLMFPSLGVIGAILAAGCGMMPWLPHFAKSAPSKAFGMVLASVCLAPIYAKFCTFILTAVLGS